MDQKQNFEDLVLQSYLYEIDQWIVKIDSKLVNFPGSQISKI